MVMESGICVFSDIPEGEEFYAKGERFIKVEDDDPPSLVGYDNVCFTYSPIGDLEIGQYFFALNDNIPYVDCLYIKKENPSDIDTSLEGSSYYAELNSERVYYSLPERKVLPLTKTDYCDLLFDFQVGDIKEDVNEGFYSIEMCVERMSLFLSTIFSLLSSVDNSITYNDIIFYLSTKDVGMSFEVGGVDYFYSSIAKSLTIVF